MEQKHALPDSKPVALSNVRESIGKSQWPLAHLLAGASGGLATAILTSPLDVLRTRLQSDYYHAASQPNIQSHHPSKNAVARLFTVSARHIRETMSIIGTIYSTEGGRAFFRGLGPSMAGVVPATAIKFYVYGNCKWLGAQVLGCKEDATIVHTQAAVAAGIATATATNPIWLVKTRLQLDKSSTENGRITAPRYKNSLDCVRQVIQQEGIRGLYRGLTASYLGTAETVVHLVLYEQLKVMYGRALKDTHIGNSAAWDETAHWISTTGAAGSAKFAAVLAMYPHEVVRTRLRQAPTENGVLRYTGLWQCFRTIGHQEGLAGLYGGLTPHLFRSIPSAVITLGVYEFVLRSVKA